MKDKCENVFLHPEIEKNEEEKKIEIEYTIKNP